jgi:hypothetical protein
MDNILPQMKKVIVSLFAISMISCGKSELPGLFIKTSTVEDVGENQIRKDSITVVNSDYFEIGLYQYSNGSSTAEKTIENSVLVENFKMRFFHVTDSLGNSLRFQSSTEFLNFMSARGYVMVTQAPKKYVTDYTFKKIANYN